MSFNPKSCELTRYPLLNDAALSSDIFTSNPKAGEGADGGETKIARVGEMGQSCEESSYNCIQNQSGNTPGKTQFGWLAERDVLPGVGDALQRLLGTSQ